MALIALPPERDRFSANVARVEDAVVVTATGAFDDPACTRLGQILEDLIDGQGNGFVRVELPQVAELDVKTFEVLGHAADRARAHGGRLAIRTAVGHWERAAGASRTRPAV